MDKYIGIDAHASSCTVVVIGPSGRKLSEQVIETNATALVDCIRSISRPRHLCLEEGNLSAWLYQMLSPHVDELVVAGMTEKRKGPKDDRRDALARAQEPSLSPTMPGCQIGSSRGCNVSSEPYATTPHFVLTTRKRRA